MLVGAFSLALGLTNDEALIFNVVIVGVFIGACIFAKADHQVRLAEMLTVLYAIVMIAVYIGVALTVRTLCEAHVIVYCRSLMMGPCPSQPSVSGSPLDPSS